MGFAREWPLTIAGALVYQTAMNASASMSSLLVRSARATWWRWLVPPAGAPVFDR